MFISSTDFCLCFLAIKTNAKIAPMSTSSPAQIKMIMFCFSIFALFLLFSVMALITPGLVSFASLGVALGMVRIYGHIVLSPVAVMGYPIVSTMDITSISVAMIKPVFSAIV